MLACRSGFGEPLPGQGGCLQLQAGLLPPQRLFWRKSVLERTATSLLPFFSPSWWIWAQGFKGNVFKSPPTFPISQCFANWEGFVLTCLLTGSQRSSSLGLADMACTEVASICKGHVGTGPKSLSELLMSHRSTALSKSLLPWASRAFC